MMRIHSIRNHDTKSCVRITFSNEDEERAFLQNLLNRFERVLPVNCMITDLDTSYSAYEAYFTSENYYVFDRLTTASIFAFDLTPNEIKNVVSNWGFYTVDAVFGLGSVDDGVKKKKLDITDLLKKLPIVITQVLDNSMDITVEQHYFEGLSQFLSIPGADSL